MIFIDRNRLDEAGAPIKPIQSWFDSAAEATRRAIDEMGNHIADSSVYGHIEARMALEKLFHEKCAYCEKKIADSDWNVEHFRPKGRVAERQEHPGYYWLAYNWQNIYPSCTYCNQRRKDKPRWGDRRYGSTGGKLDQFPLKNEDTRAMSHKMDPQQEETLLLDPCNDNPEQYFSYDPKGQIISTNKDVQRAKSTIYICHLERRRLRDRRLEIINTTIDLLSFLKKIEQSDKHNKNTIVDDAKSLIENRLLADSCEFAGAARAVYRDPDAFGVTT